MTTLLGALLSKFFTWMDRSNSPKIQGEVNVKGVEKQVEVFRDRWGVPHIYASSAHDLFFCSGICSCPGATLPNGVKSPHSARSFE